MTAGDSSEAKAVSRKEMWASVTAGLLTASHVIAVIVVFGWFYFAVPRWKREIESLQMDTTRVVKTIIIQSNWLVNYWYLLVPLAPVAVVMDFIFLRWIAKYLGKLLAVGVGLCGVLLMLSGMWLGHSVLKQELSRLRASLLPAPVRTE